MPVTQALEKLPDGAIIYPSSAVFVVPQLFMLRANPACTDRRVGQCIYNTKYRNNEPSLRSATAAPCGGTQKDHIAKGVLDHDSPYKRGSTIDPISTEGVPLVYVATHLHSALGLQPEAMYATRSCLVRGSIATERMQCRFLFCFCGYLLLWPDCISPSLLVAHWVWGCPLVSIRGKLSLTQCRHDSQSLEAPEHHSSLYLFFLEYFLL
jgi:hypothetical protein